MFQISNKKEYTKVTVEGKLTHKDYINTLIPVIDELAKKGAIKVMIIIDDFTGMELKAMVDDFRTAISHRKDFAKMAIVTHKTWMKVSVDIFKVFISGEIKIFENEKDAESWLIE
ncbi:MULTISPECIES: STAS/SEC14 domain-containing protein [unclassified Francisella]|uniref:STAS/SEC14 domain-containing protein n=1 Tax=unclassified Francisella TaxID=2610885 RepID=UPI002E348107|nr:MULTISPECIES: STAS/SEC14 domain-containing protein [unclassified Francisella]MED7818830.1 STAS/SEC14 domain-containing protein [Francisella sp. 19S2-4]MED7829715.1 STAS/SEC14 domain-containing protein [Francisella sp. 19S2-10]